MPPQIGVPIKLFHESEGHKIAIELIDGTIYRGLVAGTEDTMNCHLQNVTLIQKNGQQQKLEYVYIRGSKIKYVILPDMLKNAPMFKRFDPKQQKSLPKIAIESAADAAANAPPGFRGGRGGGGFRGGY